RCRCRPGFTACPGERDCRPASPEPGLCDACCDDCWALADGPGLPPIPGTGFCCPPEGVCNSAIDPKYDDCCQAGEVCLDNECCCDGCRGSVVCGGVCCGSDSCCNGACCGSDEVCAETSPGVRACVAANRSCLSGCYPGESCWDDVCCTPERMCTVAEGNTDVPVCCAPNTYCDQGLGTCCVNNGICTTGKKVRIRV
ncbi:MAG: hypothetical protein QM692_24930, partial [Thermomicrobiales bacterium]